MAVEVPGKTFGFAVAAADYSGAGYQFRSVEVTTAAVGTLGEPTVARSNAAAERIAGILYNRPKSGKAASVIVDGIVKWEAGAAIATAGLPITNDDQGRAVVATSGQIVHGTSLQGAGDAGEIISVELKPQSVV